MLDPANDNTWLIGTDISFRNQSEVLDKNDIAPVTKMILPLYEGARVVKGTDNDTELLTIKWPDGNISEVTYKCRLIKSEFEAKKTFELNGKKCSNPIVIVK